MIAKIVKGSGFAGVLEYALQEEKGYLLESNLSNCTNAQDYSRKLASFNDLNSRVKKPVFHVAIAMEKTAKLDDETFKKIGNDFLKMYGFNKEGNGITPYVMIRHTDTDHQHIHIIANRIDTKGHCHNPGNDYKLTNDICRKLEKEYGFSVVKSHRNSVKTMQHEELNMRNRIHVEGKNMPNHRSNLVQKIDKCTSTIGGGKRPFASFVDELKKQGVSLHFNTSKDSSRINGISYSYVQDGEKVSYKGSALGKGYSWAHISKQIEFIPERDMKLLNQINKELEVPKADLHVVDKQSKDNWTSDTMEKSFTPDKEHDNISSQGMNVLDKLVSDKGPTNGTAYREEEPKNKKRRRPKL
ncbi:MAG: relaxase/mobilization nuclease domain-containing protein [Breznakibacter sp.]